MPFAPLRVPQGDEPLWTLHARTKGLGGTVEPIDLTYRPPRLVAKSDHRADDAEGTTIAGTILGNPADGNFTIQLTSAITSTAGTFFYAIRLVGEHGTTTIRWGPLIIANT
jgi:hypothetical protein